MKRATKRNIAIGGAFVALIVLSSAIFFDWNLLRRPVSILVEQRLKRSFAINGDLRVRLSSEPWIEAHDIVIGNAAWSADENMARIESAGVRVDLRRLFSGRLAVEELVLVKPVVLLERSAEGERNWDFGGKPGGGPPPEIGSLNITDGSLRYRDAIQRADLDLRLSTESAQASGAAPMIRLSGEGRLRDEQFHVQGRAGSLLSLKDAAQPYRLELQGSLGGTHAAFSGHAVPAHLSVDGTFELKGEDFSSLYPLVPIPMPWTPPYRLFGRLTGKGDTWSYKEFTGRVGDSDMSGDISLERRAERPRIVADIRSRRLNYRDLGGFVGIPPGERPRDEGSPEQRREAMKRDASDRVLSSKRIDLQKLRALDADVKFRGERVVGTVKVPLDAVTARLLLKAGELRLKPLEFGVANGDVISDLTLNARESIPRLTVEANLRNLNLQQLLRGLTAPKNNPGRLGGRARFWSRGNSVAELLGSMDGSLGFIMSGGRASALILVLTNLDLARAAQLLLRGDEATPVNCVVADFSAQGGVLSTRTFVADTPNEHISADGNIDLYQEHYGLRIVTDSKRASPLALRGPIRIEGTFKQPQVIPEVGPVAARAAGAVALGVLATPLAALLPFIDPGDAKDADCAAYLARYDAVSGPKSAGSKK